jgi:type IV secretory pathway VirB4 component
MNDFLYKIKVLIRKMIAIFAAESGNKHARLRFGSIDAVLSNRKSMFLNSRKPFAEGAIGWQRKRGDLFIIPKLEPNPHIVISGMSGFGKSTLFKSLLLNIRNAGISCIIFDAPTNMLS